MRIESNEAVRTLDVLCSVSAIGINNPDHYNGIRNIMIDIEFRIVHDDDFIFSSNISANNENIQLINNIRRINK